MSDDVCKLCDSPITTTTRRFDRLVVNPHSVATPNGKRFCASSNSPAAPFIKKPEKPKVTRW